MSHVDRPGDVSCERGTTFSRAFDTDERPSEAVVTAIAAITGIPPADLPALNDAVDPDALDSVFARRGRDDDSDPCRVTFSYVGHEIRVRDDGRVRIVAPPSPERA